MTGVTRRQKRRRGYSLGPLMLLPVYEFGDVRVDLARVTVTRDGRPVALEPKTFDVLCFLIEHRDRLVSKEELLDAVWKDTFVTANVLTRAVAQLRKAIGDDAREARYIETATKRGYRFIAPVNVAVPPEEPSPGESGGEPPAGGDPPLAKPPHAISAARLLLSGVVLVAPGLGATLLRRPAAPAPAPLPALRRRTTQPGYHRGAAVGFAHLDAEVAFAAGRALLPRDVFDPRGGRGIGGQPRDEAAERVRLALDLDPHAAGLVADEPA